MKQPFVTYIIYVHILLLHYSNTVSLKLLPNINISITGLILYNMSLIICISYSGQINDYINLVQVWYTVLNPLDSQKTKLLKTKKQICLFF